MFRQLEMETPEIPSRPPIMSSPHLTELRTVLGADERRTALFFNHTAIFRQLIQHGATQEDFAQVDIDLLEKCVAFTHEELEKILTCFDIPHLFSLNIADLGCIAGHLDNLRILIKHGLTRAHTKTDNMTVFKKCLQSRHLEDILKFVTVSHILKLDNTPIPLNDLLKENNDVPQPMCIDHVGRGQQGEFSFEYNKNSLHVIPNGGHYDKDAFFHLTMVRPDDALLTEINKKVALKAAVFCPLVHDWHLIEETNELDIKKITLYSPELNQVMYETFTLSFPEQKLKNESMVPSISPYYEEKEFADLLGKMGCPISMFRTLPGMSSTKLAALCEYQDVMMDLLNRGVKMQDFAGINEERLICFLAHYDKAKYALALVDARECLGLPASPPAYSAKLFSSFTYQQSRQEAGAKTAPSRCCLF